MSFSTTNYPSSPEAESSRDSFIISDNNTQENTIKKTNKKIDYNHPDFQLEPDEKSTIYIFKNNLFTRELLPIIKDKERQILIKCTL